MVMSGSSDDPRDNTGEKGEKLDWSFQNRSNSLLRKGRHPGSNFRRAVLDGALIYEEFEASMPFGEVVIGGMQPWTTI